jgi:hypothetical protein
MDNGIKDVISESRIHLRDLKIRGILEDKNKLKVVPPKRGIFSFLYRGWKTIDEVSKLGGIISGSTALSLYRIGGSPIINRKPNDWDILMSRNSLLKFCGLNNLSDFYYDKDRISIELKRGIYIGNYGYWPDIRHEYIFKHDIDLIGTDELPDYIQVGKYKIATLESILEDKIRRIEEGEGRTSHFNDDNKHATDCKSIISKIHAYSI